MMLHTHWEGWAIPTLFLTAGMALAATGPSRVEMKLDHATLVWTAHQGLEVSYDGTPIFVPYPAEITVHTLDWQRALYRGQEGTPRVKRARKGNQQILTIRLPEDGFQATETIIAGPGDRFRIEWEYSQDAWDEAALQLGFSQPTERFLAGASFRGKAGGRSVEGVIPTQAPAQTTHPFANVTEVTLSSLFGTARIQASKPVTLYDYPQRGTFFLGLDEPLPRGQALSFAIEVGLEPAAFECEGLLLSHLEFPSQVEDGVFRTSLRIARREGFVVRPEAERSAVPTRVRLALAGTATDGQPFRVEKEATVSARPTRVALTRPTPQAGNLRCALTLSALPDGREVFRTPEFTVSVLPLLTVLPDRSLYTSEAQGALLVRIAPGLKGRRLTFVAEGPGLKAQGEVQPGERLAIPFDPGPLPDGAVVISGRLRSGFRDLATTTLTLHKAPPKPHEVKIDYTHRGLIVDGWPYLPFGFYCMFPPGDLPTVEAPQGFTHIAPYQGAEPDPGQVREYLDRCAAVGLKVHYDIRELAQAEPSPEKWEKLKAQVEAVRDHPALLCWYLCDEPDGQGIPPERLEEAYRFVKQLDPYHPITMVFCVPPRAPDYVNGMDIMMADPYPIPNGPVTVVSDVTDQLNRAIGYGMPLWIVPQAFGGGEGWRREPSAQEERVMTYLALIHGATGIQYFIRRAPIGNPISPSLWSECRRLALEAQELAPALLSSEPRPDVQSSDPAVHVAAWRHAGTITILAANTENRPAAVKITLNPPLEKGGAGGYEPISIQATVLFANRSIEVKDGVIEDVIDGFGTRAYRVPIGPEPKPRADIDPNNLTVNPSFEQFANVGTPDGCYVSVGQDPGASLFVDPRLAVHGQHSLRVCTPTERGGVSVMPFPIPIKAGQRYRLSIWARGLQEGLKFRFGMNDWDCRQQEFTATREWAEYHLEGTATQDNGRGMIGLQLLSQGTIWFDLMQMVEVQGP